MLLIDENLSPKLAARLKVVLLTIGNSRLSILENYIKTNREKIAGFLDQSNSGLFKL